MNPSLSDTKPPRKELGAVSEMYTGALCMAKPMPKPYINLAATRSSKLVAALAETLPTKYSTAASTSSFLDPSFSPTAKPAAALDTSAPNNEALTNCPDSILLSTNPSPPFAALVVMFSNAPDDIPMSQPKSPPATAGNTKVFTTALVSSEEPPSFASTSSTTGVVVVVVSSESPPVPRVSTCPLRPRRVDDAYPRASRAKESTAAWAPAPRRPRRVKQYPRATRTTRESHRACADACVCVVIPRVPIISHGNGTERNGTRAVV